jgi:hypothetical protein
MPKAPSPDADMDAYWLAIEEYVMFELDMGRTERGIYEELRRAGHDKVRFKHVSGAARRLLELPHNEYRRPRSLRILGFLRRILGR